MDRREAEEFGDLFFGQSFAEGRDSFGGAADPEDADDGVFRVGKVAGIGVFGQESGIAGKLVRDLFAAFGGEVDFTETDDFVDSGLRIGEVTRDREAAGGVGLARAGRLPVEAVVQQPSLVRREFTVRGRVTVLFENPLRKDQSVRSAGGVEDELRADDLQAMMDRRGLRLPFRDAERSVAVHGVEGEDHLDSALGQAVDRGGTLRTLNRPQLECHRAGQAVLLIQREALAAAAMRHVREVMTMNHVGVHEAVLAERAEHLAVARLQNQGGPRGGHDSPQIWMIEFSLWAGAISSGVVSWTRRR